MTVELAEKIWLPVALYLAIGALFSFAFVAVGAARLDRAARGAGPLFRVLIVPGAAALWPLLALMWLAGAGANRRDAA